MKPIVRLENWAWDGNRLVGEAYDHPRFDDGTRVRTSRVLANINGAVETNNTIYKLGKKL